MNIIIKGTQVEYISDYPQGWQFQAGDPFKFPVTLGGYPVFIKRFEKKNPASISGWGFLQELKGKAEPNLVGIYDIMNVTENNKPIYYVFQEFIEGTTLDQQIAGGVKPDLQKLTDDIFSAFSSIHQNGFWFGDFCEKNIFAEKGGRFVLVDLDSTQALSDPPDNDMYGSKDYWIPVYAFYKNKLNQSNIRLSDISGPALNYLQVIFLILHLRLYNDQPGEPYNSQKFHNALTDDLFNRDPGFREVFLEALQNKSSVFPNSLITKIKTLIEKKIIGKDTPPLSIRSFSSSNTVVKKGESFTLSWDVVEATAIEVNRNGVALQTMKPDEASITRTEFFDSDKDVSYEIVASNGTNRLKSDKIVIKLKKEGDIVTPVKPGGLKKILMAVAGVVILGIIGLLIYNQFKDRAQISIDEGILYEGSKATFILKDIQPDEIDIFFKGTLAKVSSANLDTLRVIVPNMEYDVKDNVVQITASRKGNGKEIFSVAGILNYSSISLFDHVFAEGAKWTGCKLSAANNESCEVMAALPMPGTEGDLNGFVTVGDKTMEDGTMYRILFTHPMWNVENGTIKGIFPISIPDQGRKFFRARVGFVQQGEVQTIDGVTFRVKYQSSPLFVNPNISLEAIQTNNPVSIAQQPAQPRIRQIPTAFRWVEIAEIPRPAYTGKLIEVYGNLPSTIGKNFRLQLRVDGGPSSNVDWAGWVDPRIEVRTITIEVPGL